MNSDSLPIEQVVKKLQKQGINAQLCKRVSIKRDVEVMSINNV
jgi:hypothetical protein